LQAKIGEDVVTELKAFIEAGPNKKARVASKAIEEKAERTAIHVLTRNTFGGKILTETRQVGDDQFIDFLWQQGNARSERMSLYTEI
jgi:hypothetical protein